MSAAREIIARELLFVFLEKATDKADAILAALDAAGCRILGPDELDTVTVERCAKAISERRALLHQQFEAIDISQEDAVYRICLAALRAAGGRNG